MELFSKQCNKSKEDVGNLINDILDSMKGTEDFEKKGYKDKYIETEKVKQIKLIEEEKRKKQQELEEKKRLDNIKEKQDAIQAMLDTKECKQLEEWTKMKIDYVLFDSRKDNWREDTSVFHEKLKEKSNLIFLIESTCGNKFGYYLSTSIHPTIVNRWVETDDRSFLFNIKSDNRLKNMMKFEIRKGRFGYKMFDLADDCLINLGDRMAICLFKDNRKHESYCFQDGRFFNYHGVDEALVGKTGYDECFVPARIIVIQMK